MKVLIENEVWRNLQRINNYCILKYGNSFGNKLINDIIRVVQLLENNPYLYAVQNSKGDRFIPLINGYKLIYQVNDNMVCIHSLRGKGSKGTY